MEGSITLVLDQKRMQDLVMLIVAAGSRMGDGNLMMTAAEMLTWMEREKKVVEITEPAPTRTD